jgi:hypothetical protein
VDKKVLINKSLPDNNLVNLNMWIKLWIILKMKDGE